MALVVAAYIHLRLPPKNHAFSQSFYYGILSAILYFIISTLLLWNMIGAYIFKAYPPSFTSLTIPQRTLMLQTISYTLYLSLGAGVFSTLEGWNFMDGLYWADYTLLTIGLGSDFPLENQVAQGLLIPYAVGGIIMIGLVVGSVRGLFLERGKNKVRRRAIFKERKKVFKDFKSSDCDWQKEFELMREVQAKADKQRRYWGLGSSFLAFLVVWFGGALVFMYSEEPQGWNYFEALYFTYVSLLTIGYGDLYPQSNLGKPFFVLWSLIAIPAVTILISHMGDTVVDWVEEGTLWLGQKTILPEKLGLPKSPTNVREEASGEESSEKRNDVEMEIGIQEDVARLGHAIKRSEGKAGKEGGDSKERERHAIASVVAREISRLAKDIGARPPKKYDWDEWKHFLGLLGESGDGSERTQWRWLANDGMLLSGATETEYVLGKMCGRLEQLLVGEKKDAKDDEGDGKEDRKGDESGDEKDNTKDGKRIGENDGKED
jgi:potassium channel subfamily K